MAEPHVLVFNVTGDAGTVGNCNVTMPKALLGGSYIVLKDGSPITSTETSNATHIFMYFTFTHSMHKFEITGTLTDTAPPTSTDNYDGLWHTAEFTITLTATDDKSGTSQTYYKLNDGSTRKVGTDGQPLIAIEGATNKLEYWSVDNAVNFITEENTHPHPFLCAEKINKSIRNPAAMRFHRFSLLQSHESPS